MDIEFIKESLNDIDEVENLYNDLCDFLINGLNWFCLYEKNVYE